VITVPDAASLAGCAPETVRRWIRSGRLPARRDGPRLLVERTDVEALVRSPPPLPLPEAWRLTAEGAAQPDWVALLRRSRAGLR
jgi:excisionase family DNA binding protein